MKPEEKKKAHKNMGSVCAGQLLLGRGPPWNEINVPSIIPLEKINFAVPSRYQLRVASWLGMAVCVHFPSCVLGFCLVWICVAVCAAHVSVFICVFTLFCLEDKMLFPWGNPPPLALPIFLLPLLHGPLSFEGRTFVQTSYSGPSTPESLTLHTSPVVGFSWFSPTVRRRFTQEGWTRNWWLGIAVFFPNEVLSPTDAWRRTTSTLRITIWGTADFKATVVPPLLCPVWELGIHFYTFLLIPIWGDVRWCHTVVARNFLVMEDVEDLIWHW